MNDNLKTIYLQALDDYNKTPLAYKEGWVQKFSNYSLLQILKINDVLNENNKILDIGTGSGIVPIVFKKMGFDICTIDYVVTGGNALNNIDLFNIPNKNVNLNNSILPFDNNSFDVIFMGDVIEHLPNSPKKIIKEFYRILKPGGYMVISTPNSLRLIGRIKLLFGHSIWPSLESFYNSEYNETHHHEYTPNELKFVFNDNGFKIDNLTFFEENLNVDKRFDSFLGRFIKFILNSILMVIPRLKSNMILTVKKNSHNQRKYV